MNEIEYINRVVHEDVECAVHFPTRASLIIHDPKKTKTKIDFCEGGGGAFCCILLIFITMVLLLIQLLIWRIFDIDILPVDDSIANYDLSNSTIHQARMKDNKG